MGLRCRCRFLQGSLALAGFGLLAGCGIPFAPPVPSAPRRRIGFLAPGTPTSAMPSLEAFREGLLELGYVEGETLTIEMRYADGREEAYRELADDLVRADVEVLLAGGGPPVVRAAQQASSTLPIVFATVNDPVGAGLVASLAHPGGNTTGLTLLAGDEGAKRVQLLKEAVPGLSRVAVLWYQAPGVPPVTTFSQADEARRALGMDVVSLPFRSAEELDALLASATAERADGLIVTPEALFNPLGRGSCSSRPKTGCRRSTRRVPMRWPADSWCTESTYRQTIGAPRLTWTSS